jgi:hypothetical protein
MSRAVAFMFRTIYRYNSLMMNDTSVYSLARKVRTNLRATALCQEPELRRVVGHANMLDGLIAELFDLGYDWNDDVPSEQTTTVAERSFTPSSHVQWADQVIGDTTTERLRYSDYFESSGHIYDLEDSLDSDQSDNLNDLDGSDNSDWDESDSSSESEESDLSDNSDAASVESFEEYGNRVIVYTKYILITKAQTSRVPSPDISVLVTVQEVR